MSESKLFIFKIQLETMVEKIVLITGPSGCGIMDKLIEVADLAEMEGIKLKVIRVFDYMKKIDPQLREETVLSRERKWLLEIRRKAINLISKDISSSKKQGPKYFLIKTALKYWWHGEVISGLTHGEFGQLKPSMIITLIDDIFRVKRRLAEDPQWRDQPFSLRDLAWLRAEEISTARHLFAEAYHLKHYLVAVDHPTRVLYDLIVHPEKPVIYLSYPVTGLTKDEKEEQRKMLSEFEKRVSSKYIVLDPLTIHEGIILSVLREAGKKGKGPNDLVKFSVRYRSTGLEQFEYRVRELKDCLDLVIRQIVDRDQYMVETSDIVIFYNPKGKPSEGATVELFWGSKMGKRTYVFRPPGLYSPFSTASAEKIFEKEEDLLRELSIVV